MSRPAAWIAALMIAGLFCGQVKAAPDVKLVQRTRILLHISPLTATALEAPADGSFPLKIDPEKGGRAEFSVNWPQEIGVSHVLIEAAETVPTGDQSHALQIEGKLTFPDGRKIGAGQRMEFNERSTTLFELCRYEDRSLIFAIEAETEIETVLPGPPSVGAPVLFRLEIQRQEGEKRISLETDLMHTFIGEGVEYAFRLGESPESDSALISLTPVRLIGGIAEIEIEISGTLPGPEGPLVLARKQQWHASRGAATALSFVSGEPAVGYRFLVSADF